MHWITVGTLHILLEVAVADLEEPPHFPPPPPCFERKEKPAGQIKQNRAPL